MRAREVNTVDTTRLTTTRWQKNKLSGFRHTAAPQKAALSDAHKRAPTFTAPSARLCRTGCQPALTCREMLAVLPFPQEWDRSLDIRKALFGLASPPCGWQESLRSLLLTFVHDILRFAPDDHPDLHREGAVVIGEADSTAPRDLHSLGPYAFAPAVSYFRRSLSAST